MQEVSFSLCNSRKTETESITPYGKHMRIEAVTIKNKLKQSSDHLSPRIMVEFKNN
jgi:hypothetical protein